MCSSSGYTGCAFYLDSQLDILYFIACIYLRDSVKSAFDYLGTGIEPWKNLAYRFCFRDRFEIRLHNVFYFIETPIYEPL